MKIDDQELFEKAKECALRYLGYRARTRKEMINKLTDYPDEVTTRVLAMLEEYRYVDDYTFAEDYVKSRVRNKGFGKFRLERELRDKGVESDIIETVLSQLDYDEVEEATQKLIRKISGILTDKDKKRYFDYLLRQGFSYDVIEQAFKRYEDHVGVVNHERL